MSSNEKEYDDVPISIGIIEIKGLHKTKPDLVQPLISPCLQSKTFGALSACLKSSVDKLQRLDIFKNLNILVDKLENDPEGHDVKVVIEAEEKKYRVNAGTQAKKDDIAFNASGQLYNVFGRAESLDVSASIGRHTTAPLNISFSKPINGNPDKIFNVSIGSFSSNYPSGAKYCHSSNHATTSLKLPSFLPSSSHEFMYGVDWRTLFGIAPSSSPSIRRSAGHSLKSAFSHTWTLDTRDDMVFPTSGKFFRLAHEFAGGPLGGDASHLRQEMFGSLCFAIFKDISLNLSCRVGQVLTLGNSRSFLVDRFQMGGPTSVRGFELNSLGPHDQDDALGGDLAIETGASLSFPLVPSLSHIMRAHVFANGGLLGFQNFQSLPLREKFDTFFNENRPHTSAGFGLLFKLSSSARLELNMAVPLHNPSGAPLSSKLQLGLGIEFL